MMGKLLLASIIGLSGTYFLSFLVGTYYKFGVKHNWFFEILHFLGGFFVAMFFSNFFDSWARTLIGLGVISFVWELHEYLIAKIPRFSRFYKKRFNLKSVDYKWGDTALDLCLNFAGAIVFLYLFHLVL